MEDLEKLWRFGDEGTKQIQIYVNFEILLKKHEI